MLKGHDETCYNTHLEDNEDENSLYALEYSWLQKGSAATTINDAPYVRNPYVSEDLWDALVPYFLPTDSPIRPVLDHIFSKRRALRSPAALRKSGFHLMKHSKVKNFIVAKHPKLKGYIIKAYLDTSDAVEWEWWKKRIDGAHVIQDSIEKHGFENILRTTKKWIYPLPAEPSPKEGHMRRNFILIVKEVDILNQHDNRKAYRKKMTPKILNALYTVIMENRLIDSVYSNNVPFCRDGRLAFIDTEHAQDTTRPVPIATVAQYLSPKMYEYWEQLITHGAR